jgi:hypothetical protein
MSIVNNQVICDDCAGYDLEWMRRCEKHHTDFCRGCQCLQCAEETDEYYDYLDRSHPIHQDRGE